MKEGVTVQQEKMGTGEKNEDVGKGRAPREASLLISSTTILNSDIEFKIESLKSIINL